MAGKMEVGEQHLFLAYLGRVPNSAREEENRTVVDMTE